MNTEVLTVRWLGRQAYQSCWHDMQAFVKQRHETSPDEIWLLDHDPVFTQGQNGKPEHLLAPGNIPVVKTDRGGQVTYHGPGQLMVYTLIDIKRKKMNVRDFVCALEKSVMHYLGDLGIKAQAKRDAPGVYVGEDQQKICSLGLRIRRGYAYHGLAFNINMDLEPFSRINPCGFSGLKMTQLADCAPSHLATTNTTNPDHPYLKQVGLQLTHHIMNQFGYTTLDLGHAT